MRIVFHAPFPLNPDARSASGIRPVKMLQALQELGHDVWLVDGHSRARKRKIKAIKQAMREGVTFDACYSESSTMPTPLTDPDHVPRHPMMDYRFFSHLRKSGTPVGVFYRDNYWQFPSYADDVSQPMRSIARTFYRAELLAYRKATDIVFLPSEAMASYLGNGLNYVALPPGHGIPDPQRVPSHPLRLFYVGGLGEFYQLHKVFEAVKIASNEGIDVTFTICCHATQWEKVKHEYSDVMSAAVTITQGSGERLHELFTQANIGVLQFRPMEYLTYSVSMKLFEYIGEGKPVIASQGTMTGSIVDRLGIGWVLPYETEATVDLLRHLSRHPEQLDAKHDAVMAERDNHTWVARAQQMLDALTATTR